MTKELCWQSIRHDITCFEAASMTKSVPRVNGNSSSSCRHYSTRNAETPTLDILYINWSLSTFSASLMNKLFSYRAYYRTYKAQKADIRDWSGWSDFPLQRAKMSYPRTITEIRFPSRAFVKDLTHLDRKCNLGVLRLMVWLAPKIVSLTAGKMRGERRTIQPEYLDHLH